MRHADYLLVRYSPATFPEWDESTRSYVLSHFTLAMRHPKAPHPFELWKRTTPQTEQDVSGPAVSRPAVPPRKCAGW
jgi:hypothetical protein